MSFKSLASCITMTARYFVFCIIDFFPEGCVVSSLEYIEFLSLDFLCFLSCPQNISRFSSQLLSQVGVILFLCFHSLLEYATKIFFTYEKEYDFQKVLYNKWSFHFQLSWVRHRDWNILTHGKVTFTSDNASPNDRVVTLVFKHLLIFCFSFLGYAAKTGTF